MFSFSNDFDLSRVHHILSELSALDQKKKPSLYVYSNDVSTKKSAFQSVKGVVFSVESNLQELPPLLKKIHEISKKELSSTDKPLEYSEIEGAIRGLKSFLMKSDIKDSEGKFIEQAIKNLVEIQSQLQFKRTERSALKKEIPMSEETNAVLQDIKELSMNYFYVDRDALNELARILEKKLYVDKDNTLHRTFSDFLSTCLTTRKTNLKLLEQGETPVLESKENQMLGEKMAVLHTLLSQGGTGDPKTVEKFKTLLCNFIQTATVINTQFDQDNFLSVIYSSKELKEELMKSTGPLHRYKEILEGNPSKAEIIKASIKNEWDFYAILKDVDALTLLKNQYGFYSPFFVKSEWTNVERTKEGRFIKGNRTITFANQFGEFRSLSIPLDLSQFKTLDSKKIEMAIKFINSFQPSQGLGNSKTITFFQYKGDQKLMEEIAYNFQIKLQHEIYKCILSLSHPKLSEKKSDSMLSTLGQYAYIPVSVMGKLVYTPYSLAKSYLLGSEKKHELNINLRLENLIPRQSSDIENAIRILEEVKQGQPLSEKNIKFVQGTVTNCERFVEYLLDDRKEMYSQEIKTKLKEKFNSSSKTLISFLKYFQRILDLKPEVMKELVSGKENEFPIGHLDDVTLQKMKMELVDLCAQDPALVKFVMHLDTIIVKHYQQVSWGYLTELQKERHHRALEIRSGQYLGENELSPLSKIRGMKTIKELLQNITLKVQKGESLVSLDLHKIGKIEISSQCLTDFNRSTFYVNGVCLFDNNTEEPSKTIESYHAAFFDELYKQFGDKQALTNISRLALQSISADILKDIQGETVGSDWGGETLLHPTNFSSLIFDIKNKEGNLSLSCHLILQVTERDKRSPHYEKIIGYPLASREIILSEKVLKSDWKKSDSLFSYKTYFGPDIENLGPDDIQLKDSISMLYKTPEEASKVLDLILKPSSNPKEKKEKI